MRFSCRSRFRNDFAATILLCVLIGNLLVWGNAPPHVTALSRADRAMLDGLFDRGLTDPIGKQYVCVDATIFSPWGGSGTSRVNGWLKVATGSEPARVYFLDGDAISAPPHVIPVDFLDECRKVLGDPATTRPATGGQGYDWGKQPETAFLPFLIRSAWTHRIGHDDLAAALLNAARIVRGFEYRDDKTDVAAALREDLAWRAFSQAVNHYINADDAEALEHAKRLQRLYPECVDRFGAGRNLLIDLIRRQQDGTFGKPAAKPPVDFAAWPTDQRTKWLVQRLDEVDARQLGQPGGVMLGDDWRIQSLIQIGEPAMWSLIECLEYDQRLTRSMFMARDFARHRELLSVKEAALTAAMSIIQVPIFKEQPYQTFSGQKPEEAERVIRTLREYWSTNQTIPRDQRMMNVLVDSKSSLDAVRAAVRALANPGRSEVLHTNGWADRAIVGQRRADNPAIAKFSRPTVAEAFLAAMDRDMKTDTDYAKQYEEFYAFNLAALDDRRILPATRRRARDSATVQGRWLWALICHRLGDSSVLNQLARGFATATESSDDVESVVRALVWADTTDCRNALDALANESHPSYEFTKAMILGEFHPYMHEFEVWCGHSYCLRILARELEETGPTGRTWKCEGNSLNVYKGSLADMYSSWPRWLSDAGARRLVAEERRCDPAATIFSEIVLGLPEYHLIARDSEERLKIVRQRVKTFMPRIRRMTAKEAGVLNFGDRRPYLPEMPPLGHAATLEDVKAGRAVFELAGRSAAAAIPLPATAILNEDLARARKRFSAENPQDAEKYARRSVYRVLVVQAELTHDGHIVYGIIGKGVAGPVESDGLSDIQPFHAQPTSMNRSGF